MNLTEQGPGKGPEPVLQALQGRLDQLPKESLNFVVVLMAVDELIPSSLSQTIRAMILRRHKLEIGPVHEALAAVVVLRDCDVPLVVSLRNQNWALIFACGANKAAFAALAFITDLPSLLDHVH